MQALEYLEGWILEYQKSWILEYQEGWIFVGKDGKLYHVILDWRGWSVSEVFLEY